MCVLQNDGQSKDLSQRNGISDLVAHHDGSDASSTSPDPYVGT